MKGPFLRLKESHPLFRRVEEVFAFMEEKGIVIRPPPGYGLTEIVDMQDGQTYYLQELEDPAGDPQHVIDQFPPLTETKIVFPKEGE